MSQMDSKVKGRLGYVCLLLAFFVFILLGFIVVEPNLIQKETNKERMEINADSIEKEVLADGTWSYSIDVREYAKSAETIMFYTNHQVVYAYSNNRICYSLLPTNSIWGHSTGSAWNLFKIPTDTSILRVEVKRVYDGMKNLEPTFYVGEPTVMTRSVVKDSIWGVIVSFTILICGFVMFCYWLSTGSNRNSIMGIFYFSVLTMLIGLWSINETQAAMILMYNRPMASYLGYMSMYFICIPYIMFLRYFLEAEEELFYKIYFAIWTAGLVVTNGLQFLNIKDLKQTATVLHVILALAIVYGVYLIAKGIKAQEHIRECVLCAIGLICVTVTYGIDLISFYTLSNHSNQVGKFGFLIFVVALGVEALRHSKTNVRQARMMEFYKELALKDVLAGCLNRNAYDRDQNELDLLSVEERKGWMIFTFDINNLKVCNDTLGHSFGDQYIQDTVSLLQKVFGENEKVYRIGGDEFCIIRPVVTEQRAASLCQQVSTVTFEYGDQVKVHCSVASGFARYNDEDTCMNDTRIRADAMMYANKKKMKEKK